MWQLQASELFYIEARRPITDIMEINELCYNADMMEMWQARALVALISKRCISSQPSELCYNEARGPIYC